MKEVLSIPSSRISKLRLYYSTNSVVSDLLRPLLLGLFLGWIFLCLPLLEILFGGDIRVGPLADVYARLQFFVKDLAESPFGSYFLFPVGLGESSVVSNSPLFTLFVTSLSILLPFRISFSLALFLPLLILPLLVYWDIRRSSRVQGTKPLLGLIIPIALFFGNSVLFGKSFSPLSGDPEALYQLLFGYLSFLALVTALESKDLEGQREWVFPKPGLSFLVVVLLGSLYCCSRSWSSFLYVGVLALLIQAKYSKSTLLSFLVIGLFALLASLWRLVPIWEWTTWSGRAPESVVQASSASIYVLLFLIGVLFLQRIGIFPVSRLSFPLVRREMQNRKYGFFFRSILSGVVLFSAWQWFGLGEVEVGLALMILMSRIVSSLRKDSVVLAFNMMLFPGILLTGLFVFRGEASTFRQFAEAAFSPLERHPLFGDFRSLYEVKTVDGELQSPRILWERDSFHRRLGPDRTDLVGAFRFQTEGSNFSTTSILAPSLQYQEALVTPHYRCELNQFECPEFDISAGLNVLRTFGVTHLIASSPKLLANLRDQSSFSLVKKSGPWSLFSITGPLSLVSAVPEMKPSNSSSFTIDSLRFLQALARGESRSPRSLYLPSPTDFAELPPTGCLPELQRNGAHLILVTRCPGVPHVIRYSADPSWRAVDGSPVGIVTPGFIGLIPKTGETTLVFERTALSRLALSVSLLTVGGLFLLVLLYRSARLKRFLFHRVNVILLGIPLLFAVSPQSSFGLDPLDCSFRLNTGNQLRGRCVFQNEMPQPLRSVHIEAVFAGQRYLTPSHRIYSGEKGIWRFQNQTLSLDCSLYGQGDSICSPPRLPLLPGSYPIFTHLIGVDNADKEFSKARVFSIEIGDSANKPSDEGTRGEVQAVFSLSRGEGALLGFVLLRNDSIDSEVVGMMTLHAPRELVSPSSRFSFKLPPGGEHVFPVKLSFLHHDLPYPFILSAVLEGERHGVHWTEIYQTALNHVEEESSSILLVLFGGTFVFLLVVFLSLSSFLRFKLTLNSKSKP